MVTSPTKKGENAGGGGGGGHNHLTIETIHIIGYIGTCPFCPIGDPTFAPTTVAPAMTSRAANRVRVMIGFLVQGRVRIKIRIWVRVRVGVTFNISVYHWSNCRRSKRRTCNITSFI